MIFFIIAYNIVLLLFFVLLYSFMERKIQARAQHRVGVKQMGIYGSGHIFADNWKNFYKNAFADWRALGFLRQSSLAVTVLSPVLFYLVLTIGANYFPVFGGGGLLLCMILLTSLVIENFFLFSQTENNERLKMRKNQVRALLGFTIFFVCFLVPALRAGGASLWDFKHTQAEFPFLLALSSPAAFLAALVSLFSLFFILNLQPIVNYHEKYTNSAFAFLLLCARRLWVIALTSYWIFVFWGAHVGGVFDLPFYVARLLVALFLLSWIGVALPGIRNSNAMEVALKALLPAGIFSLILEIFWMGFFR